MGYYNAFNVQEEPEFYDNECLCFLKTIYTCYNGDIEYLEANIPGWVDEAIDNGY